MTKVKKETIVLSVDKIKENSKNEKVHTNENLALIRASLNDVGYLTPIVVDETDTILAGHGRFIVLKETEKEIEVIKITGLTGLQKDKFRIYDN